jgi:hypothetical protein
MKANGMANMVCENVTNDRYFFMLVRKRYANVWKLALVRQYGLKYYISTIKESS